MVFNPLSRSQPAESYAAEAYRPVTPGATARSRQASVGPAWPRGAGALPRRAGCGQRTPKAQGVAVGNGQEVTRQDLMAEARAAGAGGDVDPKLLVERVVARKLLAQSAHDRGVERDTTYPSDFTRVKEAFLAQRGLKGVVKPATPTPAEVEAFIAKQPMVFSGRTRLEVDQLRFQSNTRTKEILQASDTLADIIQHLKDVNLPFDRQTQTLDSAQLPPELSRILISSPAGKVVAIPGKSVTVAMTVLNRQPVQLAPPQAQQLARNLLAEGSAQRQLNAEVERLKAKAKIEYQKGFTPPVRSAPPPAAAPAAKPAA